MLSTSKLGILNKESTIKIADSGLFTRIRAEIADSRFGLPSLIWSIFNQTSPKHQWNIYFKVVTIENAFEVLWGIISSSSSPSSSTSGVGRPSPPSPWASCNLRMARLDILKHYFQSEKNLEKKITTLLLWSYGIFMILRWLYSCRFVHVAIKIYWSITVDAIYV